MEDVIKSRTSSLGSTLIYLFHRLYYHVWGSLPPLPSVLVTMKINVLLCPERLIERFVFAITALFHNHNPTTGNFCFLTRVLKDFVEKKDVSYKILSHITLLHLIESETILYTVHHMSGKTTYNQNIAQYLLIQCTCNKKITFRFIAFVGPR